MTKLIGAIEDAPILVRDGGDIWYPRFFVKYEDGKVYAKLDGDSPIVGWKKAKLINY